MTTLLPYMSKKANNYFILLLIVITLHQDTIYAKRRTDFIVNTDKGKIRGVRYHLRDQGKIIAAFLGIPFAQPPLGHLRFKHPQPIDRWEGIYNATSSPNSCYQDPDIFFGDFYGSSMWNPTTKVSEDCLYLNVWAPKTHPKTKKAAVLVWIFGGGFYSGTPTLNLYDGRFLAAENNVIVVSIGYRVGPLGFLSLNHPEAPGNAGMFDQLMGLEWIQRNIKHFGGDPNNVTIFGESAGAVSVSLHLLSPLSRSKFQRAIMQSGSATTPWATLSKEAAKSRALDLATNYLGCPKTDDMDDILYCLRDLPAQRIIEEQWVSRGIVQFPFVPIVDGSFLIETPEMSLKRRSFKKCPIIMGSNRDEGSFFIIYELYDFMSLDKIQMNREQFLTSMNRLFFYYPQYPERSTDLGLEAIAFQYSNWLDPSDKMTNVIQLSNAVGDGHFTCFVNQFAHAYASAGETVYYYHFTERYRSNPWPEWMGVLHGDEILFAFGEPLKPGLNFTQKEKDLSKKVMQYWSNFAKYA